MLEITGLRANVGDKEVLKGVNLNLDKGLNVLLGPNGSGKTSLLLTILGLPKYRVTGGKITFKNQVLNGETIDRRVKLGMSIAFQNPPAVKGVKLYDMLRIINPRDVDNGVDMVLTPEEERLLEDLRIPREFLSRNVNDGFSGGEKRRTELLQVLSSPADFVMLDEPDSGVDVDSLKIISRTVAELSKERAVLVVTHNMHILEYVEPRQVFVMNAGKLVAQGGKELLEVVSTTGYSSFIN